MAVSYLQGGFVTADLTTYTFASQNLGAAASDRHIIVSVHSRAGGTSAMSIVSVTVGGVAATIVRQQRNAGTDTSMAGLAIAAVPSGTTGDVVVVFSTAQARCAIALWRATGISPTPTDARDSTAVAPTATLDVQAGGFIVGAATVSGADGTSSTAWTNTNKRYDVLVESVTLISGADATFTTTQTATITATFTNASLNPVGVFASWQDVTPPKSLTTDDFGNVYDEEGDAEFIDGYGEPAVTPQGFGAALEDYLTTGLYNGLFAQSDVTRQRSDYWTVSYGSEASIPNFTLIADSTRPGGYRWRFVSSAIGSIAYMDAAMVPVTEGRTYEIVCYRQQNVSGCALDARVTWFDDAGNALPIQSVARLVDPDFPSSVAGWYPVGTFASNPNGVAAHYAQLRLEWTEVYGGSASNYLEIDRASLREMATAGASTIIYPPGAHGALTLGTSVTLSTIMRAAAIPFYVPSVLAITAILIRQASTSGARSIEFAIYREANAGGPSYPGLHALVRVPGSQGSWSATPSAASTIETSPNEATWLGPGAYWFVIRNTHASNAFVLGCAAAGTLAAGAGSGGFHFVTGQTAALGATLALSDLATDQGTIPGVRLDGSSGGWFGSYPA
ncbi:MAG TPA: hypothetical protein VM307_00880 [Egibacteraceae bacterium]|nr:hypothetical protein [Egibacteraceae bacterium]